MPILLPEEYEYKLPKMYSVRQKFPNEKIENVKKEIEKELNKEQIKNIVKPGMKIAVAVGSRGISNIFVIVKAVIDKLIEYQADPFIISAMGSHGGGTEEGQRQVLAGYGITEDKLGIPVITNVDTVELGRLMDGQPVYFDKVACKADMVIPINRIKLHTDFVGDLQSGLCKMLVIGLGNQKGCSRMHEADPEVFAQKLEQAASLILQKVPVGFGVAIMENAYDQTCHLECILGEELIPREKELVKKCVSLMPFIRIKKADIIVVEEIGKDISGAGYDPNILGRSNMLKKFVLPVPEFQKMILLNITPKSHGNAIGMGFFDVITKNVLEHIDYESVYANAIAVRSLEDAKIPLVTKNEDEAIRVALKTCRDIDYDNLKIIKIKNTLQLGEIKVSESLLDEVRSNPALELV